MPELPEVETVRADLQGRITGRVITGGQFLWDRTAGRPAADPVALIRGVTGRRIEAVERRAKFLVLRLSGEAALVVHLRMTGRLRFREAAALPGKALRAAFMLDDGSELHFEDQRKFGRLYFTDGAVALDEVLARLGPEPLDEAFTRDTLRDLLRARRAQLKPLL
ncbi:MAG TPA: DNA-formamidopyrimidine glycosylase family protein, partial [Chloroflexota bacterium]|nr:DNA-formamidopyrimidine glycosylase family protein [Chloroflexota bacterium]